MADVQVHKWYNTRYQCNTDLQIDLGTSAVRMNRIYCLNLSAGGIDYTWPTTQTANFFLKVSSGTLSWADPSPSFVTINKWSTDN